MRNWIGTVAGFLGVCTWAGATGEPGSTGGSTGEPGSTGAVGSTGDQTTGDQTTGSHPTGEKLSHAVSITATADAKNSV